MMIKAPRFDDMIALRIVGVILADFLDEHLPEDRRWEDHVLPYLTHPSSGGVRASDAELRDLDLSPLLAVFLGNYALFQTAGVFKRRDAFSCAHVVRGVRNKLAHQSYSQVISDDERLYGLHAVRRFVYYIHNKTIDPDVVESFLGALDKELLRLTERCIAQDGEAKTELPQAIPSIATPASEDSTMVALRADVADMAQSLARGFDALEGLMRMRPALSRPTDGAVRDEAKGSAEEAVHERLVSIEAKLDLLLAGREIARSDTAESETGSEMDFGEEAGPGAEEPLSLMEAKAVLRTLRAELVDVFPDTEPTRSLLRQSMIDYMLEHRIDDAEKFRTQMPATMVQSTDPRHLNELGRVVRVVSRLR